MQTCCNGILNLNQIFLHYSEERTSEVSAFRTVVTLNKDYSKLGSNCVEFSGLYHPTTVGVGEGGGGGRIHKTVKKQAHV